MRQDAVTRDWREKHPTLRRVAGGLWYVAEIALFLPIDLLTVRIRDAVIPRFLKTRLPFLSCRRYVLFGTEVDCGPVVKYRHKGLFKAIICGYCDVDLGDCRRRPRRPAGHHLA